MMSYLIVEGARQNNLKNITLRIPHNKVTVITGVSGAGKSSLAMDTIFAEAHTRYIESLSTYSRMFLERIDRPDVDNIKNVRPAIALEQRNPIRTSRSTVGTVTELYDYLRLLFSKIGTTWCPKCNIPVKGDTAESISEKVLRRYRNRQVMITFPIGSTSIDELLKKGFVRIRIKNKVYHMEEDKYHIPPLPSGERASEARVRGETKVIVDRIRIEYSVKSRLTESLETALKEGNGIVWIENTRFISHLQCIKCGKKFKQPQSYMFSFNHALGACPKCKGFGNLLQYDMDKVIPNPKLTLKQGAIEPWTKPHYRWWYEYLTGVSVNTPYYKLPKQQKDIIKNELDAFFKELERKRYKLHVRVFLSRYKSQFTCPQCHGSRLRLEALQVKIKRKNIYEITKMSVKDAISFFHNLKSDPADEILDGIRKKLDFLKKVGLDYLTVNRQTRTLSGGESQRVNLAHQLSTGLTGTLYILDEPTIGLHPKDIKNLITIIHGLAQRDNTLLLVEHDREVVNSADYIINLGPGAGENGGRITYSGPSKKILSTFPEIPAPVKRRTSNKNIKLTGAKLNNLKNINIKFPLGTFICVTGVSGAGKSSLIYDTLYHILSRELHQPFQRPGPYKKISGIHNIKGVKLIDQEPISRSPRSNPATYIGAFSEIRKYLSRTQQAKMSGLSAGSFSFNTGTGRCPACQGQGYQKMEMYFLADIYYRCEECGGKRFRKEILDIKYKGKNIDEILSLTVDEATEFFPKISKLSLLQKVGLGYLRLGQPLTTLSGGEAQRLKIASELSTRNIHNCLYILDEPTTGLHVKDIKTLLKVLNHLVGQGNTVIVIEHNLDIIKNADHIIDLGPEGGEKGGFLVAEGTPEKVAKTKKSYTGKFLRKCLA